jgi:putative hydrolase of the HAD superfamily
MEKDSLTHIIFDLGGVLIGLDTAKTLSELKKLAPEAPVDWAMMYHHPLALNYEKGLISDEEFRDGLRDLLNIDHDDHEIDAAWNAMILDFPEDRFNLLEQLSRKYTVLLLSNTNDIHLRHVQGKARKQGYDSLDQHFHTAHYSHRMKMRKPDAEIYLKLLDTHGLQPHQTIFIDDNPHNVASASELGIHIHHLTDIDTLGDFIHRNLI